MKAGSDISMVIAFVQPLYPDRGAVLDDLQRAVPPRLARPGIRAGDRRARRPCRSPAGGASSALVDRLERADVRVIPFGMGWRAAFVGPAVGCEVFAPSEWGLDLVSLCPKG